MLKIATPSSQKRFLYGVGLYVDTLVAQAEYRETGVLRSPDEHFAFRRENIGMRPAFLSVGMNLDIPDDVWNHPVLNELESLACDLVFLDNVGLAGGSSPDKNTDSYSPGIVVISKRVCRR